MATPQARSTAASNELLVFINIGWMVHYRGAADDPTLGGHGWLRTHDRGHEEWNFQPVGGKLYGYIPRSARVRLPQLGAPRNAESVTGVTVVWLARSPLDRKTYVVGWFRNATIQHDNRHYVIDRGEGEVIEYQIEAPLNEAVLLSPDQRVLPVPTAKKPGNMGQSPVWYGNVQFRERFLAFLANGGVEAPSTRSSRTGAPHQADPELRQRIEMAAVRHAVSYYESRTGGSREVVSVEADNVGWDLNVTGGGRTLRVEVKGLSGSNLCVELTPNEYKQMRSAVRRDYVVYVVCNALSAEPQAYVFYFNAEASKGREYIWSTADGRVLKIEEIIGARLTAVE